MLVVTTTLSIQPGQMPPVTQAAVACRATQPHALWLLSAELGEVNTLLCLFAGAPVDTLLADAARWAADVRASDAGTRLRHAGTAAHDTAATVDALRALGTHAAVLLQVLGAPAAGKAGSSVSLAAVSGLQARHTVLTPVATHDEALALSQATVDADSAEVFDSSLWIPVKESR